MFTQLPVPVLLYVAALGASSLAGLALAALLLRKAAPVPGARLLALFLLGVAGWSAGQALPPLIGASAGSIVDRVVALAPLPSAVFLHMALVFARGSGPIGGIRAAYALATAAALVGLAIPPGTVVPWREFAGIFVPGPVGWLLFAVSALLSVAGHLRLAKAWLDLGGRQQGGQRRRQTAAVFVSSLIGLAALTGFTFPALGVDAFPWPVLGLPFYSVALVYGILRYQLMDVNLWARRTLVGLPLTGVLAIGSVVVASVPAAMGPAAIGGPARGWLEVWMLTAATLLLALAILAPLRRLADRLVFPGGDIGPRDQEAWREALSAHASWPELLEGAGSLLGARLGLAVTARLAGDRGAAPALLLERDAVGWHCRLDGWEDAPPGPRHAAALFANCLAEAAGRLERAEALALAERDRQRQERLAELGQLAASVAHDLRNPLNIVAMAAAGAPPEVRREIAGQVARMELLVRDVLDYARVWRLERRPVPLADAVAQALTGLPRATPPALPVELSVDPDLIVSADPRRLQQVLVNLLENARVHGTRVAVLGEAGVDAVQLHVCDDGPGVPAEIRDSLFRPFVSRRLGGTGLGLAVVARIMEAHGGSVALTARPDSTCLTLTFPTLPLPTPTLSTESPP